MVLPLALGLLGSGLAGAGALGALSPLIAGALGTGIGSGIQEGSLEEGIKAGLGSLALGGLGGALTGGLGSAAGQAATSTGAVSGPMASSLRPLARPETLGALGQQGVNAGGGLGNILKNMPSGMSAVAPPMEGVMGGGITDALQRGLRQGVVTGGGLGTAAYGAMKAMEPPTMEVKPEGPGAPEPAPATRRPMRPGPSYRPGYDPEPMYFSPSIYSAGDIAKLAGGGMVEYRPAGMGPMYMAAGGLADMAREAGMPATPVPEMNEKELVQMAIRAVRSELPEETAAIVLGQFVREFGEDALRKLVDDVQTGRADGPRGDVQGMVRGPGDGMDDMVPATMDDGSGDVLLSDGEYVWDAATVAMLGNGSSEKGGKVLDDMVKTVRKKSIGSTKQPNQIDPKEIMPT
jgi:hypothetical protein